MRVDDAPRESGRKSAAPHGIGLAIDIRRRCWIPTPASLFTTLRGNCPFRDAAETISQHFLPMSVSKR
ncbi:hypothetical protein FEK35_09880 [Nocardia cyriacigeorgica]|uniref:Uncharacterized protein n=1 Tax=Nocardia cyriacigeorgica TaxID=135487 RepID=A0A5R8PG90_9NOCA|nr:hypothetical protein [Nocardia cyriacigeorgica]TLG13453.1 hypothetical protein FEK35_09880 [Nocardia cyriacigeorgica]